MTPRDRLRANMTRSPAHKNSRPGMARCTTRRSLPAPTRTCLRGNRAPCHLHNTCRTRILPVPRPPHCSTPATRAWVQPRPLGSTRLGCRRRRRWERAMRTPRRTRTPRHRAPCMTVMSRRSHCICQRGTGTARHRHNSSLGRTAAARSRRRPRAGRCRSHHTRPVARPSAWGRREKRRCRASHSWSPRDTRTRADMERNRRCS